MHATTALPVTPARTHRRKAGNRHLQLAWRIVRAILATLGALFVVFLVLGLTLGSKSASDSRPAPAVTITRTVPGPTVTARPFTVWANHAVVNVNDSPAAGG